MKPGKLNRRRRRQLDAQALQLGWAALEVAQRLGPALDRAEARAAAAETRAVVAERQAIAHVVRAEKAERAAAGLAARVEETARELAEARGQLTSCQRRAEEMSRDLAQLRADLRAAQEERAADGKLLWGVVHNAGRLRLITAPRWVAIMEAVGCGSTKAKTLCERFGADPDAHVGPAPADPDPRQGRPGGADLLPLSMRGGEAVAEARHLGPRPETQAGPPEGFETVPPPPPGAPLTQAEVRVALGVAGGGARAAAPPVPPAEDPAVCTVADLRPGEMAESVDDLRDEGGILQISRGQTVFAEEHLDRGMARVRRVLPSCGRPDPLVYRVLATGRVRRTGETYLAAAPPAPPANRVPDIRTDAQRALDALDRAIELADGTEVWPWVRAARRWLHGTRSLTDALDAAERAARAARAMPAPKAGLLDVLDAAVKHLQAGLGPSAASAATPAQGAG